MEETAILAMSATIAEKSNVLNAGAEAGTNATIAVAKELLNAILAEACMRWIVQNAMDLERMKKETNALDVKEKEITSAMSAADAI